MLENILNVKSLQCLLPHLAQGSLAFCVMLWLIHCFRLYRRRLTWYPKTSQDAPAPPCKDARETRGMIRHENDLMNHRLTWFMTAEGLLFTALGFALSKDNVAMAKQLIPVLSFVGILLPPSASIVLDAADAAITRWSPPSMKNNPNGDVIGYRGLPFLNLFAPWRIYLPMFIVAWYLISQM